MTPKQALIIGILAAALFSGVAAFNLHAQGLYYDEVHQAVAAFDFQGNHPILFNTLEIGTVLVLNMSYSGAIKSNIYSLYLVLGQPFSVESWRLLGIAFVALGLIVFCAVAGRWWPRRALLLFLLLLGTDMTVLL